MVFGTMSTVMNFKLNGNCNKQIGKTKMKLSNNAYHDQIEQELIDYIMKLWHDYKTNKKG